MDENLVGYLLNALDPETQREIESYLHAHPEAKRKLETLRRALEPLASDKEPVEPAPGLVFRTLSQVAEYRCRPLPQAPEPPPLQLAPTSGRRWWRRPDVLIAAGLLIVVGGVAFPGLSHLRAEQQKTACANNLHLFHEALSAYSDTHADQFPNAGTCAAPHNVAGMFVPMLKDAEVLPKNVSLRCPGNGPARVPGHTMEELKQMSPEQFDEAACRLSGCYAYSLGYFDASGQHCGLRRNRTEMNNGFLPIMADRPLVRPENGERDNSLNHGGQNVLYIGGHVRFCKTPLAGVEGDNIYLNNDGKVAPGVNQWDSVLGCSEDRIVKE